MDGVVSVMKRAATGKFIQHWAGECKQRVNLSLTATAWERLRRQAAERGISRSEIVEQFARAEEPDDSSLERRVLDLERQNEQLRRELEQARGEAAERHRVETALCRSEARFRQLVAENLIAIGFGDCAGMIVEANDAFLQLVGYNREELAAGRVRWAQMTPPEYRERDEQAMAELASTGACRPYEKEYIHKDGRRVPILIGATLLEGGERVACFVFDLGGHRRARADLERANERFQLAAKAAGCLVYDWDLEANRVEHAYGLLELLGYNAEEISEPAHLWWAEQIHPDDRERANAEVWAALQDAEMPNYAIEYRVRNRQGHHINVCDRGVVRRAPDGRAIRVVGCTLDLSESKNLEARVRSTDEHYRFLAESIPQIVWTARPDGALDYYNRRWYDYTGLTPQQSEGWGWQPVLHPEDLDRCLKYWRQAVATGSSYEIEYRFRRAGDGAYRWHLGRALPMRDREGQIVKWFGTSTDIDDQKRAAAELAAREQAQRFLAEAASILASSLDYTVTLDRVAQLTVPLLADWCSVDMVSEDGGIEKLVIAHVDAQKALQIRELQRRYPFDPREASGVANVLRTGRSEFYPKITDELLIAIARSPEHLELLRKAGFSAALLVPLTARGRTFGAITLVMSDSGRRYGRTDLALAEDLACHAAIAIDNARLYHQAWEANRIKDEFLATVSHELRTPLNAILGWTQILRRRKLDAESQARALETIERNGRAQNQLIEDILDVSRIITGKLKLDVRPLDLAAVIEEALDSVCLASEAKHIALHCTLDAEAASVSGDPARLQQVVWNLLSNAIKFTPEGGRIDVRLAADGASALLSVRDSGVGITPEALPYIFERFRQADGSNTRAFGGLGLGLAIVRHLVELHGGTVTAHSDGPGRGALFAVRLPRRRPGGDRAEGGLAA
ncbi:PAS domain-containing protein [Gloeobacter violaceus]|uniref:Circadian input-output histidine kinase CikA n=1 Tax=Gloeobacter violaceus (strain ATCC 29082 / PCC 7421) TaxID=251221 RepID=Q7NEZ1_GLOVI|nr:PAS domain-containing protein [Gloeobacter violaceus]BAC91677.1 two-component sensor histidine kinase [Gloeobacter violaceus PCC 7421]